MQMRYKPLSAQMKYGQLACVVCLLLLLTSCSGSSTTALKPADIDASGAAAKLLEAHDGDGDDMISLEEAAACPGLYQQFSGYDVDSDGQLSSDEIASRFRYWLEEGIGLMRVPCLVTLNGKRLAGASVLFEPEPFFDGLIKRAEGKTNEYGQCSVSIDPKDLPEELRRVRGVQTGLYSVKITHPSVTIPDRYHSKTTLGREVAGDVIGPRGIRFELKSKR